MILPTRKVYKVFSQYGSLATVLNFLQGLCTNDMLSDKTEIYSAVLNAKGRFMFDFFLFKRGDFAWIDIAQKYESLLEKLFTFYDIKKEITLEKTSLNVLWSPKNTQDLTLDPRKEGIGFRGISEQNGESVEREYNLHRIENLCPEGEWDLTNTSIILEYGFQNFDCINFQKGCYVGQELIARTYYSGTVRKYVEIFESKEAKPHEDIIKNEMIIGKTLHGEGSKFLALMYENPKPTRS